MNVTETIKFNKLQKENEKLKNENEELRKLLDYWETEHSCER